MRENDELISVKLTDGERDIIIGTKNGLLIRFPETDVRSMGRTATGVKGITLSAGDEVVGMDILEEKDDILIVTKKGYGKRTGAEEYRIQSRGGKGIKTCNVTDKNGDLVSVQTVSGEEDIMVITAAGVVIRMDVAQISRLGRNTMGVKLIRLGDEDEQYVSTVAKVEKEAESEDDSIEDDETMAEQPLDDEPQASEESEE